jgi:hypothetical protein
MRRLTLVTMTTLVFSGLCVGASGSSDTTLSNEREQLRWQGKVEEPASPHPVPCPEGWCDEFAFEVALPGASWPRPGGVQVGIRWADEGDDLDLHVYDASGTQVASSVGTASTAESVLLPELGNGSYRATVVTRAEQLLEGTFTIDVLDKPVMYEGIVEVERRPRVRPLRELLPNLRSLPGRNVKFATGAYLFDPGLSVGGCYPDEMAEAQARRCLRFDSIIANDGEGPLELRFRTDGLGTDQQLRQRIYASDGSYRDRLADTYEFHALHGHFHYTNFGRSLLWQSNARGERLGADWAARGDKVGFCPIDIDNFAFGEKGDGGRTYNFERCNNPTESDPSGTYMVTGISPGWADVYNWFLADQYIEVSGVEDGYYLLESIADPAGTVVESDEKDNSVRVLIRLCGDEVDLVGSTQHCEEAVADHAARW